MMEERLSKALYKIKLYFERILPIILGLCYFLNTTLSYFDIDVPILSYIGGISFIPLVYIIYDSIVDRFCVYHRIFLYYCFVCNIISIYDLHIGIPISYRTLFVIHCSLYGLAISLYLYLKFKICKKN